LVPFLYIFEFTKQGEKKDVKASAINSLQNKLASHNADARLSEIEDFNINTAE